MARSCYAQPVIVLGIESPPSLFFPLEVAIEDNKALVRKNWSDNSGIELGDELLNHLGYFIANGEEGDC